MITNDLKSELENIGFKVEFDRKNESLILEKDKKVEIKISKIRRIFLNSIVSYVDNQKD